MSTDPRERLAALEKELKAWLDTIKSSPSARFRSREAFYRRYGDGLLGSFGYGNSELAFMRWEERGVLRAPDARPPGSGWWSNVNLRFIYLSELGARAQAAQIPIELLPVPARFWYTFVAAPGAQAWYRAHNSSIIDGYLKFPELAEAETVPEQVFINMVLYRLLFAQAMVEDAHFAFGKLGEILANPTGDAVDLITHLEAFYPTSYPLDQADIQDIMGKAHNLEEIGVEILDDVIILPELTRLYHMAGEWNQQPKLKTMIVNHKPAYPSGKSLPTPKEGCLFAILGALRKWLSR